MPETERVSWTMVVGFGVTFTVFGVSIGLMFYGPYPSGWAVLAILMSAFTWWLASFFAEMEWLAVHAVANHLNAFAASCAAVAGLLTIDHGWQKVVALF